MAVAKSYENFEIVSEPFLKDGRKYVKVVGKCPRCGGSGNYSYNQVYGTTCFRCGGSGKESAVVRWYSDAERAAQDRQAQKRVEARANRAAEKQGAAYNGFTNGFVIAILGNTYEIKDELKEAGAKYTRGLGWHFDSKEKVPAQYADRTRMIMWEDASVDGKIKSEVELEKLVAVASPYSSSTYQFEIGARIKDLTLRVVNLWQGSDFAVHTFVDNNNNVYVWTTSSRSISIGTQVTMDVTIKSHTEYKGVKQTVLTRPRIKQTIEQQ